MAERVYILGGYQSDFARKWSREGLGLYEILEETVLASLNALKLAPAEIEVAHVGNFCGESFRGQAHLGGFLASIHKGFCHIPASRHEAACASGSMAILAAAADIEAGRYENALSSAWKKCAM